MCIMTLRSAGSLFLLRSALLVLAAALLSARSAHAQVLLDSVATIAAPTTGVPLNKYTFDVTTAGSYKVTVTDLGAAQTPPAPLASLELAVTGGDAIVGTPLSGAGTLTLSSLTPGTYQLHIAGMPGAAPGSGPIGIQVAAADGTPIASWVDVIALPSQGLPNSEGVLNDHFTVASSGSYDVSLNDLQLPLPLGALSLVLIQGGSSTPIVTLPNSGSMQATVSLSSGVTYDIFAVGQAGATASGGLFSAVVAASGGGAVAYGRTVPVGTTVHVGSPTLKAGSATFTLTDLATPAALSQLGAVLTLNGQPQAQLNAAGSQAIAASVNTYEAFVASTAGGGGAGSYALQVTLGATVLFAAARPVVAPGSTLMAYSFDTTATAGSGTVSLTDFQFPSPLASLSVAAVQGGALLGQLAISGGSTFNINVADGPLSFIAFAQPGSAGAQTPAGLFGIDLTSTGAQDPEFETTQGVGGLFSALPVTVTGAGNYRVNVADLAFPASFMNFAVIVTRGTDQLGSIVGGGHFSFPATPGQYLLNFIAEPAAPSNAGTYAMSVAPAPAPPTVSLSVDRPQVNSGDTVNIIWSSTNATSCSASGGWSGSQAVNGTKTSAPLTSNTTFTLACTGAGGDTTSKSVSVTVQNPSGGGGGGALDIGVLALLAGLALRSARTRRDLE
jgi:hypothetical protein